MRPHCMRTWLILSAVILPSPTLAEICVENATGASYLFTVENRAGERARATLLPGQTLCLLEAPQDRGGTVAAFEDATRLEGCSRLVDPGGSDRLLAYAAFDRCLWASHGD